MANLTITLPEEQWATMLNLLTDHPFKQVAPLIHQIQRQLQGQLESAQGGNGASFIPANERPGA